MEARRRPHRLRAVGVPRPDHRRPTRRYRRIAKGWASPIRHGVAPFELAVVCEVFGCARPEIMDPWPYEVVVASPDGTKVRTNQCFALDGVRSLAVLDRADTIIVPAWTGPTHRPPDAMI